MEDHIKNYNQILIRLNECILDENHEEYDEKTNRVIQLNFNFIFNLLKDDFFENYSSVVSRKHFVNELLKDINLPIFVTTYITERCYGGPEEGGWWYNHVIFYDAKNFYDSYIDAYLYHSKLEEEKHANNESYEIEFFLKENETKIVPHYC